MKPNFFNYATNELSQDAFFCWLIEWSLDKFKNENYELHKLSLDFLKKIIPNEFSKDFKVNTCKIFMQRKNMDFIAEINNTIIIHFEDKIKSHTTDYQLSKYKEILEKDFPKHRIYNIYLKTDLIWPKEKSIVEKYGYTLIDLMTVGDILKNDTSSDIYNNYYLKVKQRIDDYSKYKTTNPKNWDYNQWIGFVYDISLRTRYSNFDKHYVGEDFWFVFSWFEINGYKDSHVSFEIINKKCAIKAHVYDKNTNKLDFLNYMKEILIPHYKDFKTKVYKRAGKSMLAIEFMDFIIVENNIINFEKTILKLLEIRDIFDNTIKNVG